MALFPPIPDDTDEDEAWGVGVLAIPFIEDDDDEVGYVEPADDADAGIDDDK